MSPHRHTVSPAFCGGYQNVTATQRKLLHMAHDRRPTPHYIGSQKQCCPDMQASNGTLGPPAKRAYSTSSHSAGGVNHVDVCLLAGTIR